MNIRLFTTTLVFGAIVLVGAGCAQSNSTNSEANTVNTTANTSNANMANTEEVGNEEELENENEETTNAGDASRAIVSVYLVALEDNGETGQQIGCGDSLVPVVRPATDPGSDEAAITNAMEELFAIKDEKYGESGLYSALYQSDLTVDSVAVSEDGVATVELSGDIVLNGTCDTPRAKEQILSTATQFSNIDTVEINLNGKPLDEALSGKGE